MNAKYHFFKGIFVSYVFLSFLITSATLCILCTHLVLDTTSDYEWAKEKYFKHISLHWGGRIDALILSHYLFAIATRINHIYLCVCVLPRARWGICGVGIRWLTPLARRRVTLHATLTWLNPSPGDSGYCGGKKLAFLGKVVSRGWRWKSRKRGERSLFSCERDYAVGSFNVWKRWVCFAFMF